MISVPGMDFNDVHPLWEHDEEEFATSTMDSMTSDGSEDEVPFFSLHTIHLSTTILNHLHPRL